MRFVIAHSDGRTCCAGDDAERLCDACRATAQESAQSDHPPPAFEGSAAHEEIPPPRSLSRELREEYLAASRAKTEPKTAAAKTDDEFWEKQKAAVRHRFDHLE
jgi:hypothetical protein